MPSREEFKQAHIGLAVVAVIVLVGGFLARDAGEAAMQLVGLVALIAGFGTTLFRLSRLERGDGRPERDQ